MARGIAGAVGALFAFATAARAQVPATDEAVLVTGEVLQGTVVSADDDPDLVVALVDGDLRRVPARFVRNLVLASSSSTRSLRLRSPAQLPIVAADSAGALSPCVVAAVTVGDVADHVCAFPFGLDAARVDDRSDPVRPIAYVAPAAPDHVIVEEPPQPQLPPNFFVDHEGDRIAGWVMIVASAVVGIAMLVASLYFEPQTLPPHDGPAYAYPDRRRAYSPVAIPIDLGALAVVAFGVAAGLALTRTRDGSSMHRPETDYTIARPLGPSF